MSGAPTRILPTFFVIGASKAGTTSLHFYLGAHPEIEMTTRKEPHFMIGPGWEERTLRYADLFEGSAGIRGDCSPGYAVYPMNADAAPNIAAEVPDARIVYCVRDPVERCIAQYAQHLTNGEDDDPIEVAIRPADPGCEYVNASRFATNLEAYLGHFDRERILIVDQRDLRDDRRRTLSAIFAHVGADGAFWTAEFEREHNVRGADNVQLPGPLRGLRRGWLNEASKRILPGSARAWLVDRIRGAIGRNVRPEPGPELRRELERVLGEEADRFRALTGRQFAHWSV